jgi:hypothetical protein
MRKKFTILLQACDSSSVKSIQLYRIHLSQGFKALLKASLDRNVRMRAIKKARKIIEADQSSDASKALTSLILALETDADFSFKQLYELQMKDFDLMIEVMKDWRLDRYYEGKAKAISTAIQATNIK